MLDSLKSLFQRTNKTDPNHKRAVNAASERWSDDPFTASASSEIRGAAVTVNGRVAGLYLNDAIVRSGVTLLVSNIVGNGIRANTSDNELDTQFNTLRFDPSRRMSLGGLQQAAVRSLILTGEVLIIHRMVDGEYACQVLDPDQLDRSNNAPGNDGGVIINGVEFDRHGRISAYWILPHAPGDPFATNTQPDRYRTDDVIHVFEQDFPGQVRGISRFVSVLTLINQAGIAIEARLKQLQVSAMLTAVLTNPNGDDAFDGEANPSLEPGAIIRARPGEEVSVVNGPTSPDFERFMKVLYRQVASAIGVTYEDLLSDMEGTNYSSFRGGSLTARRKAEATRKAILIEGVLNPIFARWQAIERLAGRRHDLVVPGWIEPSWPQIDPAKEARADIALLDAKLKSRKEIIEARGRDFEAVNQELERDATTDEGTGTGGTE